MKRADFRRYAAKYRGEVFADAEIRNRHGVRESAESFTSRMLARVEWDGLRQAASLLVASSANDQKAAKRIAAALALYDTNAPASEILPAVLAIAIKKDGEPYGAIATATFLKREAWIGPLLDRVSMLATEANTKLRAIERAEDAAAALALALRLDIAYERAKARAGALDFDDLIANAQNLLSRSDAAPWVLYKLDGGLDHILIDEGQDTSPAQWDLIAPLQDEFFAGIGARDKPRTVFAVGDPKQSIYAFQGADPGRFLSENQKLSKRAHRAKQTFKSPVLATSFRTSPEVLRVVDAAIADKPLIEGTPGKHDVVEHLAARDGQPGMVELWPLTQRPLAVQGEAWDTPLDVETGMSVHAVLARELAKRVKTMLAAGEAVWDKDTRALRPLRPGDVLALVRTRGALFRELIKAFKRAGLPVAGADRMVLKDELAVEDCLALMRVALDPADDLSLACVLKGPWLGLENDDEDLFPLAFGREKQTLHARLMTSDDPKYAPAQAFIAQLIARAGDNPFAFLSWALETPHNNGPTGWTLIFQRLGLETRDPLEELLQRALKLPPHRAASLQRFLNEIETDEGQVKRELEAEGGAIRVMTVHGAKGLEAPLVILPDSTGPVSDKPEEGLIFDDETGPYVSFRERDDDTIVAKARAAHEARMLGEHWRLYYVAMTRARDRLIVCGAQHGNSKVGEANESWRLATELAMQSAGAIACETPFGEGLRLGEPQFATAQAAHAGAKHALPTWAHTLAPGASVVDPLAPSRMKTGNLLSPRGDGQKRFRRGKLIHGLLERLPEFAADERAEAAHVWLTRQGADEAEAEALAHEALSVLNDPAFAPLFGPASRAEAPIIGEVDGKPVRGIVDRLSVDQAGVMVLDFKTDRPAPESSARVPEAYVLQMALYREVMRAIFPQKSVRCALLWTEAPRLMELPQPLLDAVFDAFRRG
jgi:ATP-dependent helicase/nuclease subunit A